MARVLVVTKRQYMSKDLLDDRFGRFREIPLELARRGHRVRGLCFSYAARGDGTLMDGPVAWESIDAPPWILPGIFKFIRRMSRLASTADCIWACSDSIYGVLAQLVARRYRVPVIFDLYDNFEYYAAARLPLIKQLYRRTLKRCDAVTCVSRPLAGLIKGYGRDEAVYILENGVRSDLFQPMVQAECRSRMGLEREAVLVGTAGALHESRGIVKLVDAFFLLKEKYPTLHLVLAGPRSRSFCFPRDERIHDRGILALDEVPCFLNALDIAVVCNQENEFGKYCFPQKAREIMACNIPLVAAGVGAMRELLRDRPEWLYRPDSASDFARVLEGRLFDRRTNYGNVLDWRRAALQLENVVKAVLSSSG